MKVILRSWRGVTRAEDADLFVEYLNAPGIHAYRTTPGNRDSLVWRKSRSREEFLELDLLESLEGVKSFAGDEVGRAVFDLEEERSLIEMGEHMDLYEVVEGPEVAWSNCP